MQSHRSLPFVLSSLSVCLFLLSPVMVFLIKFQLAYQKYYLLGGTRLYSFRMGKGFRGIAYRDGLWLRILSLHPDHDSAYR